jgi:hypothetical protein
MGFMRVHDPATWAQCINTPQSNSVKISRCETHAMRRAPQAGKTNPATALTTIKPIFGGAKQ